MSEKKELIVLITRMMIAIAFTGFVLAALWTEKSVSVEIWAMYGVILAALFPGVTALLKKKEEPAPPAE